MNPFERKSIFIWQIPNVMSGNASAIAQKLLAAGFTAIIIKAAQGNAIYKPPFLQYPLWLGKANLLREFVDVMHANGIAVAGFGFNRGVDPEGEGRIAASQVITLGLDGWVWDVEGEFENHPDPIGDAGKVLGAYRDALIRSGMNHLAIPTALCSWAYWTSPTGSRWHRYDMAKFWMSFPFVGYCMPMLYWSLMSGTDPLVMTDAQVVADAKRSFDGWRANVSQKPFCPVGRAYTGDGNVVKPSNLLAFDAFCRQVGVAGISWWGMDWAHKMTLVWDALSSMPKLGDDQTPDPLPVITVTPDNQVKTYGTPFTAFTGMLTGVRPGDDITARYSSAGELAEAPVGSYLIQASLQDPDGRLQGYQVIKNTALLTVKPVIAEPVPVTGLGWIRPRYVANGPAIVVGNPLPKASNYVVPLATDWQAFIKKQNDNDPARWKLFTAPDVGPTKGMDAGTGKLKYIMHTWSGNVVKIIAKDATGTFLRIASISSKSTPPDSTKINYKKTPWLVHTMTSVNTAGQFFLNSQPARNTCRCPIMSLAGVFWLPAKWVMSLDTCDVRPLVKVDALQIYDNFSFEAGKVKTAAKDTRLVITRVVGDQAGNLWGKVSGGWACIVYQGVRQTSWWL